jgi:hypothetical protein
MEKKLFRLVTFICLLPFSLSAQLTDVSVKYANTIKSEDLRKHLEVIASDAYEGRETGEKGQKMAADYISKFFKKIGLKGPNSASNPYLQPFKLYKNYWDKVSMVTKNDSLKFLEDFFVYGNFSIAQNNMSLVFAGYGIDETIYSDYEGLDVKGKAVVVLMGEPTDNETGNYLLSGNDQPSMQSNVNYKIQKAGEMGASALIFVYDTETAFNNRLSVYKPYLVNPSLSPEKHSSSSGSLGVFFTGPKSVTKLFGISTKKYEKLVDKLSDSGKNILGKKTFVANITAEQAAVEVTTENVLGYMEGTDLKEELLVVTAHYDHIGKSGDEINNGADDDGSGTVTVLEIAEAFTKAKADSIFSRRSILFMTVTGEEKGLLGSAYYSDNPVFPLNTTIANLNIDMVGRVDEKHARNPNYIYVIGSDMLSTELHRMHEDIAKKYAPEVELDYQFNAKDDPNRFYYRSDHYNFAKHGIPVIFYFNGTHEDYHKPTDTIEKINFDKMENIGKLIFHTAWELANRNSKPVVDKLSTDE